MFKSKNAEPTVIGRGAIIEGKVRATGRIQVDGTIDGSLEVDGHVSVGPSGVIMGELIGEDLAIGGRVEGEITARKHLHVASSGVVRGDVRYDTLQVDRGATLDGRTLHGENEDEHPSHASPSQAPAPIGAG